MLTPTRIMRNVISGFASAVDSCKHNDVAETVMVSVVHNNLLVARATTYAVNKSGVATPMAESEPVGKDNSASPIIFNDGTLWMIVCEAEPTPESSGTTNRVDIYEYLRAFQPAAYGGSIDSIARQTAVTALGKINDLLTKLRSI